MNRPAPHWFGHTLRRRSLRRHFVRHTFVDTLVAHDARRAPAAPVAGLLVAVAQATPEQALARMHSRVQGLSTREAAARLAHHGPNEVEQDRAPSWWHHLWLCYRNPFNILLTVLALVSWMGQDAKATIVIASMVLLSTLIRFVQEGRSHRAADGLKALVGTTATVLRHKPGSTADGAAGDTAPVELALRRVVPGDVVLLSAGDMVPADCRVLAARDLFIAQAAMTGESLPVEKFADDPAPGASLLERRNLLFMGTSVVSGSASALVVHTGASTYFGTLAASVMRTEQAPTAFQAGVNSVSWLLIRFALVMVPVVLLVNGFTKGNWGEAALFALSVAVGLTPEMLPMIVTTTLAKGALALARRKVVVKRLDAIQNLGAMDVLCTDKTGTLTQDKVAVARKEDAFGQPSRQVLAYAFLNSHYQTGLKNLLDHAVLEHYQSNPEPGLVQGTTKIDEIPFDFERRRMSVIVARPDGVHELVCKGAVEEVLAQCSRVRGAPAAGTTDVALDDALMARVQELTREHNADGLRVVAVAVREMPPGQSAYSIADETALTLVGFIAFLDPPKDSAAPALQALAAHGVQVKVLTGDNALVTARVCHQVGLAAGTPLLGDAVEALDDDALALAVREHQVFAKLTPLHKQRVVRALRANGHVVGFLGDGINDAPALRAADVGISVDSAVDIAKEAADIILLEKSLLVLDAGVVEGRSTFCNMLKYIRMTASSNFGNVFSVLVASAFLPFLPMLPLQLLVQNLLYDIAQTGIPFDAVDAELVAQPLQWNPGGIGRFMLFFGPVSSLFDIATFVLMWSVFGANNAAGQHLFQSGWFVVGLLTQTLVVHMIRTPKLPFIQSRASLPLLASTGLVMAAGIWLPMGPMADYFRMQALPPAYFGWLVAILLGYGLATTAMKHWYIRRFGWH